MEVGGNTVPSGYHRRYLLIDLTDRTATFVPLADELLRRFVGGSGLGTALLLQAGGAGLEPLAPSAPLVIALSPLVGSPLTTSAKFAVVSKSPLTERLNDSLVSSTFAMAAKKCGCDAIVLRGRAAEPTVVIVDDGRVRLEPAGPLWGMTCSDAIRELAVRHGPDYQSAVIGPAGERLVRYATISHAGRHAGRGGSGAVMGSKNVKAMIVRGTHRTAWHDPGRLAVVARALSAKSLGPATAKYRELGTAANILAFNRLHTLPTRNFQQGSFEGAAALAPESLMQSRGTSRASCAACTIGCEHLYASRADGAGGGTGDHVRVEYENLFALGSLCGVADPEAVLAASRRCDELGLDTISAGGTIAFAMECVDRGWLAAPWLTFGSGTAVLRALDLIAGREGLGDALAEGSRRLAHRIGQGAIALAPQVKGLEIPGYDPRAMQTLALGLAVSARGADHNRSGAAEVDFSHRVDRRQLSDQSAAWAVASEDQGAVLDSLILCRFLRSALEDFYEEAAHMLTIVTGWTVTADELRQTARRIVTARKWFNIQAGWTPQEDCLPDRFLQEPLPDDPRARLTTQQLQAAKTAYHRHRGWTDDGWIEPALLQDLGLSDMEGMP